MSRTARHIIVIGSIVAVATVTIFVLQHVIIAELNSPQDEVGQSVEFVIASNESVDSIANQLNDARLIRSPTYFRLRIQFSGKDSDIVAGKYDLNTAMTTAQIIDTITNENAVSYEETTVTFPEGLRFEEYADLLLDAGLIDSVDEFNAAAQLQRWNDEFSVLHSRPSGAGLEGYLFPDTYVFRDDATAEDIIELMLQTFEERVTPQIRASAGALGLTFHQAMILASIVEREASTPEERPLIASVYYNRIVAGMPLQADPTVQYQQGKAGDWWPQITGADTERPGAYNTYLNPGFPPGPICNPGLDSIRAAFAPAETNYLFFVARGDGTHAFAETFEEHQKNIDKYQGESTP